MLKVILRRKWRRWNPNCRVCRLFQEASTGRERRAQYGQRCESQEHVRKHQHRLQQPKPWDCTPFRCRNAVRIGSRKGTCWRLANGQTAICVSETITVSGLARSFASARTAIFTVGLEGVWVCLPFLWVRSAKGLRLLALFKLS
jgi:hypothetical protein